MQEVIVQNFRAKPGTRMARAPDAAHEELLWSIAVARLILGPAMNIQAPPNLSRHRLRGADRRGHQRLGRRVAGHARSRQSGSAVAGDRGARARDRLARQDARRAASRAIRSTAWTRRAGTTRRSPPRSCARAMRRATRARTTGRRACWLLELPTVQARCPLDAGRWVAPTIQNAPISHSPSRRKEAWRHRREGTLGRGADGGRDRAPVSRARRRVRHSSARRPMR